MSPHPTSEQTPAMAPGAALRASAPTRRNLVIAGSILGASVALMLVYHNGRTGGDFSRLLYGDSRTAYLPAGEGIRAEGLGWFFTERSLWTGPLNPLWIAALGARIAVVKVANIGLFALTGLATWDIARRLFDDRAGYVALALYATYLPFYQFTPTLLTEPLFVALLVFAFWFIVVKPQLGQKALAVAGVSLGLATLARPTSQLYPLFLFALWAGAALFARRRDERPSIPVRELVLIAAGFTVVVAPYALKNLVSLDKIGIANGGGAVLYIGNDLRTHGYEPIDSQLSFNTSEITSPYTHLDSEGDRRLTKAAINEILAHPIDIALLQPSKALRLVFGSPGHYFRPQDNAIDFFENQKWVARLNLWTLAVTPLVALTGAVGLVFLPVPPLVKLSLGSFVLYMLLVNTILFPIPRMFLAAFPVLMVFTGGAWSLLSKRTTIATAGLAVVVTLFIAFEGMFNTPGVVSERYVEYFDLVVEASQSNWIELSDATQVGNDAIRSIGPDPFIVVDVPDFEASINQLIFVTIRTPRGIGDEDPPLAQVFWRTDAAGFAEERSSFIELLDDGEPHVYSVSPSFRKPWSGIISEIRLDLPDYQPGNTYEFDELEVRK